MKDQIILQGIRVMTHIGVPPEERAKAQQIELNVVLELDVSQAARSERLSMSVDYAEVHQKIVAMVHDRPRQLLENLVEEVAQAILAAYRVEAVEVEARKFVLEHVGHVAVKIRRSRR